MLLVDRDASRALAMRAWLHRQGFEIHWITGCHDIDAAMARQTFDCIVIDLSLSCVDVVHALRRLNDSGARMPTLILSEGDQVQDRIRLLESGAADFLIKPLHLDELVARIKALMHRHYRTDAELRHGSLRVLSESRTVQQHNRYIALTDSEFTILEALMRSKGRTLKRYDIEAALRGRHADLGSNTVEVHVHHLRRKLGSEVITTVRGMGYKLGQES
jgi:DNA-binding response OmpR family regulator